MKINFKLLLLITIPVISLSSCSKDNKKDFKVDYFTNGVYVVNEGSYGAGNSSVSYLNLQAGTMSNDVFAISNGFPLGDVAQSMTILNNKGYIVVNNSQKIEVVDLNNMLSIATITGFQSPRYFISSNNKGYVSDWFDNNIKVIDLSTNTITNTIPTGNGPEQMVINSNKLFVVNVGGFGTDNTVTVIDLVSETVLTTVTVGVNPNSICTDANGKIWVLCSGSTGPDFTGGTADDIAGSLWKVNSSNQTIETSLPMGQFEHPVKLTKNGAGTDLYFLNGSDAYTGKVCKTSISNPSVSGLVPLVDRLFYGLGVHPVYGTIYGGFVPGFTQNGHIFRYELSGNLIDSMEVGIAPNFFVFK